MISLLTDLFCNFSSESTRHLSEFINPNPAVESSAVVWLNCLQRLQSARVVSLGHRFDWALGLQLRVYN
ncbi:hypothetical protein PGT21_001119 [Puccinia graminis f. sp. tritici]|uniref:Uncharacterized protein n=1 Tax=Puccinia graminis f. sp. tritici TaxID=56615 RepID=A0A5B0NVR7_PUCGR|nr:hypothetical protein PGT21_001119 [Puccinia graminis f. sp. tritici]